MKKKDTFKNKESWDDISSFINRASEKAHKQNQVKQMLIQEKGKIESGKGKTKGK